MERFPHRYAARVVLDPDGDPNALGGAVTVALCGAWHHDPPCRWPHHSTTTRGADDEAVLLVEFDAPDDEVAQVRRRIDDALATGRQADPEGAVSAWRPSTPDIQLLSKTADETARWLPTAMSAYERARLDAGDSAEQAAAARLASETQFFPSGRPIEGQLLFTVEAEGEEAGWLWIGRLNDPTTWWVWDVAVLEPFRRHGIGREVMRFAEEVARHEGATAMRLNVFSYNGSAIRLYERLGYAPASMHLHKRL